MRLTLHTFLTLDGVMQGPGSPTEDVGGGFRFGGWQVPFADDDMGRIVAGWFTSADALLLGRSSYEAMYPYWSKITTPDDPIAVALNRLPKHVVSNTRTDLEWANSHVVTGGDVVQSVADLKAEPGRELQLHGSWQLARAVHDAGLVDEYRLLVYPVVVGSGKRLFAEGSAPAGFSLIDSTVTSRGAVYQVLRPHPIVTGDFTGANDTHPTG